MHRTIGDADTNGNPEPHAHVGGQPYPNPYGDTQRYTHLHWDTTGHPFPVEHAAWFICPIGDPGNQ